MTRKSESPAYSTHGSVCGSCDHRHRSISTARRCINRDQSACASQGGYSDRYVVALNEAAERELEMVGELDMEEEYSDY